MHGDGWFSHIYFSAVVYSYAQFNTQLYLLIFVIKQPLHNHKELQFNSKLKLTS